MRAYVFFTILWLAAAMAIMLSLRAAEIWGQPDGVDTEELAIKVRRAMIVRGYDSPAPRVDYLELRTRWIVRWNYRLKVPQEAVDEQIALWVQESKFGLEAGAGHASNFGQVTFGTFPDSLALIERRGYQLPEGPEGEVALAVSAYRLKLSVAKGDIWRAVRLYNGAGPRAQRHLRMVRRWHKDIFGR